MIVTKYASAATRVILQQSKTVLVWIFFLAYPGGGHERFKVLQLIGFLVLLSGVILYNEILTIPILGFNQYTKAAIAKREENKTSIVAIESPKEAGTAGKSKDKEPLLAGDTYGTANTSPYQGVNANSTDGDH